MVLLWALPENHCYVTRFMDKKPWRAQGPHVCRERDSYGWEGHTEPRNRERALNLNVKRMRKHCTVTNLVLTTVFLSLVVCRLYCLREPENEALMRVCKWSGQYSMALLYVCAPSACLSGFFFYSTKNRHTVTDTHRTCGCTGGFEDSSCPFT